MRVHVKGISRYCSLNLYCKEKWSCFVFEAFEILVFPVNRATTMKSTETTALCHMMDSLLAELIAY